MSKQEIQIDAKVTGLDSVEKLTEEIEDLGKTSKKAAKQVDDLNDEVKKTTKSASKSLPEVSELSEKFSKMGGAGGAAAAKVEMLGVMMSGPLGLAIAGTVVALGTALVAVKAVGKALEITTESVKTYVEGNKTLSKSTESASNALTTLKETFGAAVVGGEGFKKAIDFISSRLRAATNFIIKHADTIFETAKKIANAVLIMIQAAVQLIATMAMGIVAPFDLALTALHKFRKSGLELMKGMLEQIGPALVDFGLISQATLDAQQAVIRNALGGLQPYKMELISELHDLNTKAQSELKSFRKVIGELQMGPLNVGTARRTGGGGGGGAPAPTPQQPAAGPGGLFGLFGPAAGVAIGQGIRDEMAEQDFVQTLKEIAEFAPSAQVHVDLMIGGLNQGEAEAAKFAETLRQAVFPAELMVAEGMIGLAETAAQAAGAFMVTGDAFKNFGDVVLDTFGSLSTQIGSFFIKTGIGMTLISPATGAGLIAAGLGLQVLGGALGAKGSGNRGSGGGGGGGGAGVSGAVTREIQRSLRAPDAGGAVTNIEVVIAGRAIEPEMVHIIDDISRLRRSRGLARLGA